ncbi:hypothetical protein A3H75_00820 [Candidatus Uhrbacteria bacterium RIFCSPLOWO2_02_FULL_51_9]|uniref:HAD family hydrolase n=1 Tax=Candidatus Uhrbacteria bacterium RIFCSPLOWO2_02_FULL_51_9 TaxID=1802410 RepID=A0A1F7VFD7_9BACT|nr:MAG: hypothetical protein A3H75_00820 [Candidatus Uhrbacteria bacterium RIFCSPLOWO2_02_FULL_51_9]
MKNFRAIGFDWGGVILQYPGGSFNDAAATFLGIEKEVFRNAYFLHNHLVNKGSNTVDFAHADDMWRAILQELGKEKELAGFMGFVKNLPKGYIDRRMLDLVLSLRKSGFRVGLLSNGSRSGAEEFRKEGYDTFFDVALFSGDIDYMKPEQESFLKLASALNVNIHELIFVDDSKKSLETAEEVGYEPVLFTDYDALLVQLKNLGITLS